MERRRLQEGGERRAGGRLEELHVSLQEMKEAEKKWRGRRPEAAVQWAVEGLLPRVQALLEGAASTPATASSSTTTPSPLPIPRATEHEPSPMPSPPPAAFPAPAPPAYWPLRFDRLRPLVEAVIFNDAAAVRALLDDGRIAVDAARAFGWTPLHLAAISGRGDALKELLTHGADATLRDRWGPTALHFAAWGNDAATVRALLADGRIAVDAAADDGKTPLHWAAEFGRADALKVFLAHGADVTLRDNEGRTALQIARENGKEDCARQLREARRRVRVGGKREGGGVGRIRGK